MPSWFTSMMVPAGGYAAPILQRWTAEVAQKMRRLTGSGRERSGVAGRGRSHSTAVVLVSGSGEDVQAEGEAR